jgi:lipoprotein-releasing system ATP-binding protein
MEIGDNKNSGQSKRDKSPAILEANGLRKRFVTSEGELEILRGIDLNVAEGEMISIVGSSGAGKSTLLYLLGGLDSPSEGCVAYGDDDLADMDENRLARFRNENIGFVYQFHYLLSEFSALENVMMPLLISGYNRKQAEQRAYNILSKVNLKDRVNHRPGKLSGGEQQRVAVARALVNSPRIVFADEPSGNLDENTSSELHQLLKDINRDTRTTFLIATHNRALAETTDKKYILSAGILSKE